MQDKGLFLASLNCKVSPGFFEVELKKADELDQLRKTDPGLRFRRKIIHKPLKIALSLMYH